MNTQWRIRYLFSAALLIFAFHYGVAHAAEPARRATDVRIQKIEVVLSEAGPVVLLRAENKAIPVFVDVTVAESIHAALSGGQLRRPYPHNLMHTILTAYEGRVTHVAITLKEATYYAALTVVVKDTTKVFDSRASDAIALATHFKAPIMVSRELLDKQGQVIDVPGAQSL